MYNHRFRNVYPYCVYHTCTVSSAILCLLHMQNYTDHPYCVYCTCITTGSVMCTHTVSTAHVLCHPQYCVYRTCITTPTTHTVSTYSNFAASQCITTLTTDHPHCVYRTCITTLTTHTVSTYSNFAVSQCIPTLTTHTVSTAHIQIEKIIRKG